MRGTLMLSTDIMQDGTLKLNLEIYSQGIVSTQR